MEDINVSTDKNTRRGAKGRSNSIIFKLNVLETRRHVHATRYLHARRPDIIF